MQRLRGESMQKSAGTENTAMRALIINAQQFENIENAVTQMKESLPEGEIAEIANVNSKTQIVISGTAKGVDYMCSLIQRRGLAGRSVALPVSAPFHCSLMQGAANDMRIPISSISFKRPKIDVISNVNGLPV
jgi:[acyl-carrier-protein] S-malonyltransferase